MNAIHATYSHNKSGTDYRGHRAPWRVVLHYTDGTTAAYSKRTEADAQRCVRNLSAF